MGGDPHNPEYLTTGQLARRLLLWAPIRAWATFFGCENLCVAIPWATAALTVYTLIPEHPAVHGIAIACAMGAVLISRASILLAHRYSKETHGHICIES